MVGGRSQEKRAGKRRGETLLELDDPALFFNRELSWLEFNRRVLEEAEDARNPLLERVKFLAIFCTNLDEFFMIRVSGLCVQTRAQALEAPPDGMTPEQQLAAIRKELLPLLGRMDRCWRESLRPGLAGAGIGVNRHEELGPNQQALLRRHFEQEIFPALTPLAFDPGHPFPHISNLSINLAVEVGDPREGVRFARLKVPQMFPRLVGIPSEEAARGLTGLDAPEEPPAQFVWLEDVVAANLDLLFPGMQIRSVHPFRVTRDADPEIEEDEASDLLTAIEESISQRHFGFEVRLEFDSDMPPRVRRTLTANLRLDAALIYDLPGPIGLAGVMELTRLNRPELKDKPFVPTIPRALSGVDDLFAAVRRRDVLLYHPYDSFAPVVDFVRQAARDPQVLAIKCTLYRVGPNSPIVDALMEAREEGKQVAVLVELKARFDEEKNIEWARALERAGVHVVYGLVGLKTHAKVLLVVRREADGLARYVHMSTGNYNDATARIYTDLGLLTADPDLGADASDLFNALTGYSRQEVYRRLLVAPGQMQRQLIARVEREIDRHKEHGDGYLAFKMNALVDKACIQALYRASRAGVRVDLQVRSICCLRPGVPGLSETITVTSVVGRFLEHTRIYYFRNGGEDEILLGSADLMPRNLYRRVEALFPLLDPDLRAAVRDHILAVHLGDNVQARRLLPNGRYERIQSEEGQDVRHSQCQLLQLRRKPWHGPF